MALRGTRGCGRTRGHRLTVRARREKNALFQWEEDNPPGNCCSSRKQPERELLVTAEREASGAKGPARGSASTQARMKIERQRSLETSNVTAEPIRTGRRPLSAWEASSKSTEQKHRGSGAGMWAKEEDVNTGSPRRWGQRPQPEAREGQAGSARVAERSVVAKKRVMIAEPRDLSSRSTQKQQEPGRLTSV